MSHPLRWLALVALERAAELSFEELAGQFARQFPTAAPPRPSACTENLLTVSLGEFTAAITLIPRPIPAAQLEGPAATAWYWPDAARALAGHEAHLLVTLVDDGGAAVKAAEALTRLTAAAAAASPSAGVFWGPGRLVHEPRAFVDQAVQMGDGDLPLFLWIDFRIEPVAAAASDGATYRLFTTGLEALGHSELEAVEYRGEPQALLDMAYNVAHYMLVKRKVLDDGDTLGVTDAVQAVAHRGPSMLGGDLEVVRLSFETVG